MSINSSRIQSLDYIRGVAVLMVLLSHMSGRDILKNSYFDFTGLGHVGVYLFFSLSSYLLLSSMLNKPFSFEGIIEFFVKRFFRILPLYYIVAISVFAIQLLTGDMNLSYLHILDGWKGLVETFFFVRGDSVFWSIVSEFHFYVLVPLIVLMCLKDRYATKWILTFIIVLNGLVYYLYYFDGIPFIEYLSPHKLRNKGMFLDVFLMPALILITPSLHAFTKRNKLTIQALFYLLLSLTIVLVCKKVLFFERSMYNFRYLSLIFSLVFGLFIVSQAENVGGKKVFSKIICYLGTRGFSIYLLHFPIMQVVNELETLPHFKPVFFITVLMIISEISYRGIEQRGIAMGNRLLTLARVRTSISI